MEQVNNCPRRGGDKVHLFMYGLFSHHKEDPLHGLCAVPKGLVFNPFWSETGYRFNHLDLKSAKVLYTLWNHGLH